MLSGIFSTAVLACNLLLASTLVHATELQIGKTQEGVLHDGRGDTYDLKLKAGDYVEANFDVRDTELLATVYDPSGTRFRAFRVDSDNGTQIAFIGDSTGSYKLALNGTERSKAGSYSITLSRIVSLDERLAPAPPREMYESSYIRNLKTDLHDGKSNAVSGFWEAAKAKTTPLLEPIEGDNRYMLATFLWQGNETTRNVEVQWFPYSRGWPDDYRMVHLENTDVWYKTLKVYRQARFVYRLAPNASYLRASRDRDPLQFKMFIASGQTDPLNPKHWLHYPDNPDPAKYQDWSAVEMPDAPPQPWAERHAGVPAGVVEHHQFTSMLLKNEREISLYLPPGYDKNNKGRQYGLVVLFDGGAYEPNKDGPLLIPAATTFDNLIAAKRIPPVVGLLIGNPPALRNPELECNLTFLKALHEEMIPWLHQHYNVTNDPKNTVVGGLSLGGLSATCAAFHYPATFGNVLSQSGSFSWTPPSPENPIRYNPEIEPNWMARQFIESPQLPLRFYITAGLGEFDPAGRGQDVLVASRHFRDVLLAKGYEVHYQEFYGGHDFMNWRGSLADGLMALLNPPPPR